MSKEEYGVGFPRKVYQLIFSRLRALIPRIILEKRSYSVSMFPRTIFTLGDIFLVNCKDVIRPNLLVSEGIGYDSQVMGKRLCDDCELGKDDRVEGDKLEV
ncbi:uncharacterized protein LOC113300010 [Papaver somniferum]|uniref:uncharacterized protein LOC113300010 n=1 Tax=Papaver somniferum TaxID=3469 RepID=UPI000E6F8AD4|nr:uncharacterized protein LOC113300010 [Papaver somniferum]